MELKQMKYFKTIVDEGTITQAARVLHISQPPLSMQLKAIEEELDTILIERTSSYHINACRALILS